MTAAMQASGEGRLPGLVGIEIVHASLDPARMEGRIQVQPHHHAPNGFLHAATVIALADTLCGYGCAALLAPGAMGFTTVELKSNFLGTAREGAIRAVATPVHLGRSTHLWDAVVTREADNATIALFRCTQMILWPKAS
jgi:uncharacterized protein (TIGR00369 family)